MNSRDLIKHSQDARIESNGKYDEILTRICHPEALKWQALLKLDEIYVQDFLGAKYGCKLLREAYIIHYMDDLCIFRRENAFWLIKCIDNS